MSRLRRPLSSHSPADRRPVRRGGLLAGVTVAASGAGLLLTMILGGIAQASTPVTLGYRDFGYGGALASRPTAFPEQSKLWYNDGAWWGGLFVSSGTGSGGSHFDIFKFDPATQTWTDSKRQVDIRDLSHGDYLWDDADNKLYVASSKSICTSVPAPPTQGCNDQIRVYRYSYNAASTTLLGKYTLDTGYPKVLAGALYRGGNFTGGGTNAVTIARDSAGELWLSYTRDDPTTAAPPITHFHSNVYLAHSADGVTWTAPVRFAAAADGQLDQDNTASVVAFGTKIGIYWTDKHLVGMSSAFFAVHNDGDPVGTWSGTETIVSATNAAQDQVNLKSDSAGKVYAVIKTGVANQIVLYDRSTGGAWTGHAVATAANANTRAQVVIDEQLGLAYVFSTSGGTTAGTIYVKAAPLNTLSFPTGKGAAFISSATDTAIDDVTLTKQTVTATTGILAEASDRVTFQFLHRFMTLAATDNTAPAGTATIDAGAAFTGVTAVTVADPATDAGSGVALVRLANTAGVDGAGVLNGASAASLSWAPTVPWTLAAGDGLKTVYVQWQDHAGNWSVPVNDTITLDQTGPNGSVTINNGDVETSSVTVSLDVTATDAGIGVVTNVRVANVGTTAGGLLTDPSAVTSPYTPTMSWNITPGPDGPRTVYVQWQDSLGNWSGVSNDSINLHDVQNPVGHVAINGPTATGIHQLAVNLVFPSTGADVTEVKISNSPTMAGAVFQAFHASIPWTLPGPLTNRLVKHVYVVFKDGAGNVSDLIGGTAYSATDSAIVDLTKPVLHGAVSTSWVAGSLAGNSISLRATWPVPTDTITGVGSYRVWLSTDGHAYTFVGAPIGRTAYVLTSSGHTYRFRVYAVDRAGNASASIYSPTVRVAAYQDSNAAIHYAGSWHLSTSPLYYGGTAHYASTLGASASLTFTGRSVAWVAALAPTRGSARVYVDGHLISTVNLNSATTTLRRIVFTRTWSTGGTHTIRVTVLGTAGHPRVDVDAFIVLR